MPDDAGHYAGREVAVYVPSVPLSYYILAKQGYTVSVPIGSSKLVSVRLDRIK